MEELQDAGEGDRGIVVKIPSGLFSPEQFCPNVEQAITYIKYKMEVLEAEKAQTELEAKPAFCQWMQRADGSGLPRCRWSDKMTVDTAAETLRAIPRRSHGSPVLLRLLEEGEELGESEHLSAADAATFLEQLSLKTA